MEKQQVILYVDGGCRHDLDSNMSIGGWGIVLIYKTHVAEFFGATLDLSVTNNRAELLAAINGFQVLKRPCKVNAWADSTYLIHGASKAHSRNANPDLWKRLDAVVSTHSVDWRWLRGHGSNMYNRRCDTLATEAMDIIQATRTNFNRKVREYDITPSFDKQGIT